MPLGTAFLLKELMEPLGLSRLLDPANTQQFDDFKKCYGEILYRWGLREKRAEVLKFVSCPPDPHKGIGEYGHFSFPAAVWKILCPNLPVGLEG